MRKIGNKLEWLLHKMSTMDDVKLEQQQFMFATVHNVIAEIERILIGINNVDYENKLNQLKLKREECKNDINNMRPNTPSFIEEDKIVVNKLCALFDESHKFKETIQVI